MIKAVVFDCFGVLVGPGFRNIYRYAGGNPDQDWGFIEEMLYLADTASITREEFADRLSERLTISVDKFNEVTNQYEVPHLDMFDYIRDELKPRYKVGVLSNANFGTLQRTIPQDLLDLFDYVAVSGEIGYVKPQAEAYNFVCYKLGVEPSEAVFVDDQERYVSAANAYGMRGILYRGLEDLRQQLQTV